MTKAADVRCASRSPDLRWLAVAALLLGLLVPVCAHAQGKGGHRDGLVIPVQSPIESHTYRAIERAIVDELKARKVEVIIFDFNPEKQPSQNTLLGPCIDLKHLIARVRDGEFTPGRQITTVAFLQHEVKGYTILPVLACNELVMTENALLGPVQFDGKVVPKDARNALNDLAKNWDSPDAVRRLHDEGITLVQVQKRGGGRNFVSQQQKTDEQGEPFQVIGDPVVWPHDGQLTPKQVKAFGGRAVGDTSASLAALVNRYELLPRLSREVLMMDRTVVAYCIEFTGTVDAERLGWLDRSLHEAVREGANLIFLHLNSHGGDTDAAYHAAKHLSKLKDKTGQPVRTIAFVPAEARLGAATYLALGCSEIVMSGKAALGDFTYLKNENAKDLNHRRERLKNFAASVHLQPGEEFDALFGPEKFQALDAKTAKAKGIARYDDVESLDALYGKYGLRPNQVTPLKGDWFSAAAAFLRLPLVMALLVMVGIAGLILEFKMPGIGVPGVVAAICFVLFFWAHSFVGEYTVLAVFLFILGLILVGLEIFVLPGFGVTGISGILLILVSLALVTLEKIPASHGDWVDVGTKVLLFGGSLVGAFVGAMVIAWFLPNIPYASRLVLAPPVEGDEVHSAAAHSAAAALLGAIGVAATTLRPAGKARFGEEYLDVIAENDYVNPGSRVQVIEIEGNRIVVKEV